ncbi:hypothetical protein [Streptosporangium roseum]|uniref:hypothetical protein n=1 Tax=Streptosporangium roseum TaxID=2001 RepID=UPI0004CDA0A0|nr:hypothetical protein [Streptosporangium roseum]
MGETPAVMPGTGPLAPEFNGIDPALMNDFIADLERAGKAIAEYGEAIRRELAAVDLSAPGIASIREIGGWAEEQLPRLRQRMETIEVMPAVLLGSKLEPYSEGALPAPAEAQRQGAELGKRVAAVDPEAFSLIGPYPTERLAALVNELKAHQSDPNFTAAFFAALGPAGTRKLGEKLRRLEKADDALGIAGTALGAAVRGGPKVPGFAQVMGAVKKAGAKDIEGFAELLNSGDYPDVWLAEIVAPMLAADSNVSGETLGKLLNALGNNPVAARLAISSVTNISPVPASAKTPFGMLPGSPQVWKARPDLAAFLKTLNERVHWQPEAAKGFGRMLAAASGAYDEAQGKHSQEAAFFAYTVMTSVDDLKLGDATRPHLSEIAGSYAAEIALGANIGDADMTKDSALRLTPGLFEPTTVPGLRGAFRLSPEDTFRFLTTFAGTAEARAPFEAGMGELTQRLLPEASRLAKSTEDVTALDNLFTALGNVRGFELAAAVRVLKPLDEEAESAKDAEDLLVGALMGVAGLVPPFSVYARTWTGICTGKAAYDTYGPQPEEKVEKLRELDGAETLGRQYAVAQLLMKQGFTPGTPPSDTAIADSNGNLRPFSEIAKRGDVGMKALEQWFIDNGMGAQNRMLPGGLSRLLADRFDGRKNFGYERAHLYKNGLTTD